MHEVAARAVPTATPTSLSLWLGRRLTVFATGPQPAARRKLLLLNFQDAIHSCGLLLLSSLFCPLLKIHDN